MMTASAGPDVDAAPSERRRSNGARPVLGVTCAHGHCVANVYGTPLGLVYTALIGPHADDSRRVVDQAHHGGHRGRAHVDMLTPTATGARVDDALPAWCACGPRTLSRAELIAAMAERHRSFEVG